MENPELKDRAPASTRPDRVRDHLANERTYLAWIRTALALLGLGFVLARMGLFLHDLLDGKEGSTSQGYSGSPFMTTGIVICVLGTVLALWSGFHYRRNRVSIDQTEYRPPDRTIYTITVIVVIGGILIVGLLLARHGLSFSS